MKSKLLTRDEFRNSVFERDRHTCVVCKETNIKLDAHHIIEKRLFTEDFEFGGYFIDNGASVCEDCHLKAESTEISCDELRRLCNISKIIIPFQLEEGNFDKWGNQYLNNGMRTKGPLFYDPSVQKVLNKFLHLFTDRVKYPKTPHLPSSPGAHADDIQLKKDIFEGKEVIITVKMDGQNVSMYNDYIHNRSVHDAKHPSMDYIKSIHAKIRNDIPSKYRICAESLYAKHSIYYDNLKSYLQVFSIWNDKNICLSWKETEEWCELLGLQTIDVLYRGKYDSKIVKELFKPTYDGCEMEGLVVRLAEDFPYSKFRDSISKMVRLAHVKTIHNWKNQIIIPNKLK